MESLLPRVRSDERPPRRALVVDDTPESGNLCRAFLRKLPSWDVDVVVELRSRRAIERLKEERFDLVVTDFQMPDHTGADVIMAARHADASTRCVLVTGYEHSTLAGLPEVGIDGLLTKPLRVEAFVPLVERLLAR